MSIDKLKEIGYWIGLYFSVYMLISFIYMDFNISNWYIGEWNVVSTIPGRILLTVISMVVYITGGS